MGSVPGLGLHPACPAVVKKKNRPLSGWVSPPQQGEKLLDLAEAKQGAPTHPPVCVCSYVFPRESESVFSSFLK